MLYERLNELGIKGAGAPCPGVISRGVEPPLLKFLLIVGGPAQLGFLHWLNFSEFIGLAFKVL